MFPLTGGARRRAYTFFRGRMPTFARLCEQIDAILGEDKRDFAWYEFARSSVRQVSLNRCAVKPGT